MRLAGRLRNRESEGAWNANFYDFHRGTAVMTNDLRAFCEFGQGLAGVEAKQELKQRNPALTVGMEETEVACASKTFGQYVLEDEPQELGAGKGASTHGFTLGVPVAEGHLAVLTGDDVLLPDDTSVQIASEIDQGFFAATDELYVDHPFPCIKSRKIETCFPKGFEHFGPEDFCKGFVTEEKTFAFFGAPQALIRFDGGSGHDQMDM